jgi:hypothetical protein
MRKLCAVASIAGLLAAGCGPGPGATDMRAWTSDAELRVAPDVVPPRALEQIHYSITVRDRKTHEPIANGQGRIFATNADGHSIYDGFSYGPEVGVYHATLMFVTAGDWAINVQFRRDSTKALEKPEYDWRQTVMPASEPGSDTTNDKAADKPAEKTAVKPADKSAAKPAAKPAVNP